MYFTSMSNGYICFYHIFIHVNEVVRDDSGSGRYVSNQQTQYKFHAANPLDPP
jgi:hypothetical protein